MLSAGPAPTTSLPPTTYADLTTDTEEARLLAHAAARAQPALHAHAFSCCHPCSVFATRSRNLAPLGAVVRWRCYDAACCADERGVKFFNDEAGWRRHMKWAHSVDV